MRFSVIIPLYNKAPYVAKALQSVIGQTFRDFEIVVVDDGSSDGSGEIAGQVLGGCGCAYQVIHQANAGVGTAKNNGVSASSGDHVCFLDADDWWAPTFLERMDWLIGQYPEAGIFGTNYYYVKNGRQRVCVTNAATGILPYCKVYAEGMVQPLWTGAVCLPRARFDEMGGFKPQLKLGEDFDLWIRLVLKYDAAFLDEPLSYYNQDADPAGRLVGKLHDPAEHMLWHLDYLEDEEQSNPEYKQLVDNLRTYCLLPYYLAKEYREAARQQLSKVDWDKQDEKTASLYRKPIWWLRGRRLFLKAGSAIKQAAIRHL